MPKRRHISGEEYARQQALKKERIAKQNHECFLQERQERLYGKADSATLYEQYSRSEESAVEKEKQRMRQSILEKERREAAEKERREAAALAEAARARKVLVCGDARGHLAKLFATAEAQNSKVGPFDALLCVGAFMPEAGSAEDSASAYLGGQKQAPLECFFIDPGSVLLQAAPRGKTLGNCLHFLGAYGIREVCGLRVAFLSGHYDPAVYDRTDVDFVGGAFTCRAVGELQRRASRDPRQRGVDILLTCGWPAGLEQRLEQEAQRPPELEGVPPWQRSCAPPLAELCHAIEPRYHLFGSANLFYQRPPFKTLRRGHACRCISLGQVGSASKQQKWLHALALSPMAYMKREDLAQLPAACTACPFVAPQKRPAEAPDAIAAPGQQPGAGTGPAAAQAAAEPPSSSSAGQAAGEGDAEEEELRARAAAALAAGDLGTCQSLAEQLQGRPLLCAGGPQHPEDGRPEDPRRKAADAWLKREPKQGVVRFTFKDEGDLGLRLSQELPPWILEVRDGSLAAKKAPRVPLGGVVIAINGHELAAEEGQEAAAKEAAKEAIKALERRPAILDVRWPGDLRPPVVKYA